MNHALVIALAVVGGFSALLVGITAYDQGVSTAQRVMTDLVMPIGLLWLGMLGAAVYQHRRGQRLASALLGSVFLAIGVLFSPPVADRLILAVESPLPTLSPLAPQAPRYHTVVVLGGGVRRNYVGQSEFVGAGERIALAAKLWHADKTEWIICTGSEKAHLAPQFDTDIPSRALSAIGSNDPAEVGRELLVALGVPDDRILRAAGQNTTAEMFHLAALLQAWPERSAVPNAADPAIGLITSAFHLPRASRLADDQRLTVVPIPAGTQYSPTVGRSIGSFVPNASAGENVARALKEVLAKWLGR